MKILLELCNIRFQYRGMTMSKGDVLKDVSCKIFENECVALLGSSGSGKTTLIQLFTGLLKPQQGHVLFQNRDIWSKDFSLSDLRKKIGLVFQFPESQLFEETVFRDVAFGPKNLGFPPENIEKRIRKALSDVELDPDLFGPRSPFKLSEGEKRRAAIAGVLAMEPDMIVFDEPTAGLDPKGVARFTKLVRRLLKTQKTVVVVTHNMDFVAQVANRVIVLKQGKIEFTGKQRELFTDAILLQHTGLEPPAFVTALHNLGVSLPEPVRKMTTFQELKDYIKTKKV
ncbi:energy-coupling factor transporter ATPase [candidate division KSB1 bacterium]|nr:energy-coupling factor transporter ATPase [candidate division KSB1 bacterium]